MAFNNPPLDTEDIKVVGALTEDNLMPFVTIAVNFVTELLSDKGLSDNLLRQITIYLAAHFAFVKQGQTKSEKLGDISETFNMESGQGLQSTVHGQQAIFLDTSGTLFAYSNRSKTTPIVSSKLASITVF